MGGRPLTTRAQGEHPLLACFRGPQKELGFLGSSAPMAVAIEQMSASSGQERATALHKEGLARNEEGDVRHALSCFLRALAIDPSRRSTLISAGNMHLKLKEAEQALRMY